MEEFIDFVAEDAEALGCEQEVNHTREIIQNGTSAHRQIKVFEQALADGASEPEALKAIVDMLIEDTLYGI